MSKKRKLCFTFTYARKIFFIGFGINLTEAILDTRHTLPIRQLATVLIKQYIDSHWWKLAEESFRPPETLPEVKAVIRELLPRALGDPNSKIRSGAAHAISAIAMWDWPEEWPDLFTTLMMHLTQGTEDSLQGSMCVLLEVTNNVDDKQMPQVWYYYKFLFYFSSFSLFLLSIGCSSYYA